MKEQTIFLITVIVSTIMFFCQIALVLLNISPLVTILSVILAPLSMALIILGIKGLTL